MVEYIRGRLVAVGNGWLVVETGGLGLRMRVHDPGRFRRLRGRVAAVPAWLDVQRHRVELYGFLDDRERARFLQLIAIPGVGAATALKLLPAHGALTRPGGGELPDIPGLGPRKRARIARWLARRGRAAPADRLDDEVVAALRALGLGPAEARARTAKARTRAPRGSTEELVRLAVGRPR